VFSAGGEIHLRDENREAEILVPVFGATFPKEGA